MRHNSFFRLANKLFGFLLCISVLPGSFTLEAQTRRAASKPKTQPVSGAEKQTNPRCAGGWSGVVTYKKILKDSLESDEPGIRKAIDRIKHKTSRDYDYTGRALVDGSDPKNTAVTTNVSFTDNDLKWGQEKVFDTCNSRESGHWFIIESTDDRVTQATANGAARSFNLFVDESSGTYHFNLKFPDANGVYKREQHVKRSGHCQAKNNEPYDKSENQPTVVNGESFSVDSQKIDPRNPDTISGTKIWGDDGTGRVRTFVYQVTWRFTRCPQKLLITDLKFEHPKFPNFEDWKEIPASIGTIDGNRVRIKAKVLNMSAETKYADLKIVETYKGDKYNGARADEPLPEAVSSLRLEAGEEREAEFIWDTEGASWFDDGRPHLLHRIKAELAENNQKKDEMEKPLNIAPKPLVLVHGIWSDYKIWEPLYQNLLTTAHSYNWKAYPIGSTPLNGNMNMGGKFLSGGYSKSVYENADELARYIRFAQAESNAWHIDMVAHTTGGLVARLYLHKLMPNVPDARPQVKHLMMLGTPNNGAPCIDVFAGKFNVFERELKAAKELTNEEMTRFNQYVVNTGGTKISALAGNIVPVICGGYEWNDGFTTVKSALHGVSDTAQSNDISTNLVDARNFGNFVKPHIVAGPKGTYPFPVKSDPTDWKRWQGGGGGNYDSNTASALNRNKEFIELLQPNQSANNFVNAAFKPDSDNPQSFSKELKLAPKQILEVEMPIESAANLGVTFIADASVSVSLVNDKGAILSKSAIDSPFAQAMFRTLFTRNPVAKGVWKLKLENTSDAEQIFLGFSWSAAENANVPDKTLSGE